MVNKCEISEQLLGVLVEIKAAVQKILDTEDQKYDIIKNMETDQLIAINEDESIILYNIENFEIKRMDLVETLSLKIGFDPQQPISKVALFLSKEYKDAILTISMDIRNICTRIDIITDRNEYMLNSSVEIISQILELSQGTSVDQYNSHGLSTDIKKHNLHMLDQLV